MKLAKHAGYWTLFDGGIALASFDSFERAWKALYQLWEELRCSTPASNSFDHEPSTR